MFYYLRGKAALIEANLVVLDCGGVGFSVNTTTGSIANVRIGEEYTFYTHCAIREDAFDIYGFYSKTELNAFRLLISVTGVGPKAALSILSAVNTDGLKLAVLTQNEKMLTAAPGIGKKIAQRIILELKDKLASGIEDTTIHTADAAAAVPVTGDQRQAEAVQALLALGYDQAFISGKLKKADLTGMTVQDIIKYVLKQAL